MQLNKISMTEYPKLEQVLEVGQGSFGYLNPAVNKDHIATDSLGPCIGVYLRERKREFQSLAHLEFSWDYGHIIDLMLEYLVRNDLTSGEFDKILLFKSNIADENGITQIDRKLINKGYKNREIIYCDKIIDVIFDKEGAMHWIKAESLQNLGRPDTKPPRYGIRCENNGVILS